MNNVVVYIKTDEKTKMLLQEHLQSIFYCCLHKNANIVEFYMEKTNSDVAWNKFICDAEQVNRKWNELIVPSFDMISKSTEIFKTRLTIKSQALK